MTDQYSAEYVRDFLSRQTHMIIAVTQSDGSPWAVPVHIKRWNDYEIEWESRISTIHSEAIEKEPRIAISMHQLTFEDQVEFGFYAQAVAKKIKDLPHGLGRYRATMNLMWGNGEDHKKTAVDIN